MQFPSRFLVTLASVLLFVSARSVHSQAVALPADSLLQDMAAAYTKAQSYSDKGVATYHQRDGGEGVTANFQIWFARPGSIRVDAESTQPGAVPKREVLWSDGTNTRTWATGKPVSTHAKVKIAGSGLFGAYAYHIPSLLDASYGARRRLHQLSGVALVGEEIFEGVNCHHLRGQWEGDDYEVWIGSADHLVRKIVATYSDHKLEEIHRDIHVDQSIPKTTFQFAPENETVAKKPMESSKPPAAKPQPTPARK